MKFETRVTWEAPLARVLAMITSRAYVEQRLARMDYESFAVLDCQDEADRFAITTRVLGRRSEPTVASVMALGSGTSLWMASVSHWSNCLSGSAWEADSLSSAFS